MEATTASMMTFGVVALLASWVVLLIVSWKDDYAWGLCTLLLPPLSYLYALARLDKAGRGPAAGGRGLDSHLAGLSRCCGPGPVRLDLSGSIPARRGAATGTRPRPYSR